MAANQATTNHPHQPRWVDYIRFAQGFVALLTLALTAFAASVLGNGAFAGFGLSWFTCIFTLFFLIYSSFGCRFFAIVWNTWVLLSFEIAALLFWLIVVTVLACETTSQRIYGGIYYYIHGTVYGDDAGPALGASKAAAIVGGVECVLFGATLVTYFVALRADAGLRDDGVLPSYPELYPGRGHEDGKALEPPVTQVVDL